MLKRNLLIFILVIFANSFSFAETVDLSIRFLNKANTSYDKGDIQDAYKYINQAMAVNTNDKNSDTILHSAQIVYIKLLENLLSNYDESVIIDILMNLDKYPDIENNEIRNLLVEIESKYPPYGTLKLNSKSFNFSTQKYIIPSIPIVSGFGIFYRTPYEEAIEQINEDGFQITETKKSRNANFDRKLICVSSFVYDNIPYNSGTFCFDRDIDGKYYFTVSEGLVDTDKIDSDIEYAAWFSVFLNSCAEKYSTESQYENGVQLIGFKGNNDGLILLSISDTLYISYHPKSNRF